MFPWKRGRAALVAHFTRGRRWRLFWALVTTAGAVIFSFLSPQIVRLTVDSVIDDQPFALPGFLPQSVLDYFASGQARQLLRSQIWLCAAAVIAVALLTALCNFIRRYFAVDAAEYTAKQMRDRLYDHIQHLPYDWHVKVQTGDIIQRCTSDVEMVKNFLANQLFEILRILILMVTALVLMFSMDAYLTWMSLLLMPVIFIFSFAYYAKISGRFRKADESEGMLQATVQENLTGVRVVRAFGRERFEMERFDQRNDEFYSLWVRLNDLLAYYWGFGDAASGIQLMITVAAGTLYCIQGNMTLGTFLSFYTYSNMFIWPVRALGRLIADLGKTGISLERILEILKARPETDPEQVGRPEIKGQVTFDHVTFGYGDEAPVLKDMSFTVEPGETLGILGGTGSGKSTLAHLLCRLYDVPEGQGRILIDGEDIRNLPRQYVRQNVGLVLQEPFLFSKTIRENIAATDPAADLGTIRAAARIASVDDAITGFENGYDTIVGERGVTLSGGQKQRVAISRMLMQHAKVMIFDDSLSAVDAETDSRIRHALEESDDGSATRIIISHRITTLQQADKILVLKDGAVEEYGTHETLLRSGGTYSRVAQLQGSMKELDELAAEGGEV